MKKHIKEEIEALTYNIEVLADKLRSGDLSALGLLAAEELIKTLNKIKNFISHEDSSEDEVNLIISKLPLLYFQIPKIN